MRYAKILVNVDAEIEGKSRDFVKQGFKPLDALHLACAESSQVDYFCTTDDKLLKRAKSLKDFRLKVVSPTELIEKVEK